MPKKKEVEEVEDEVEDMDEDENSEKTVAASFSKKYKALAKEKDFEGLIKQVDAEYQISYDFMKPKIDEWTVRLKLYSNQRRDKEAIGDPLLFTVLQTVLASLYNDRLAVAFEGRDSGDEETAENLNSMASFDYDAMEKPVFDYEWDFDACFFGRSLLLMLGFDRERKCPSPEVIDPMTWLRDPRAKSVNGDMRGRGAMKFGGREMRMSKNEMDKAGIYFNYKDLKPDTTDLRSLIDNNEQARNAAQGRSDLSRYVALNSDSADCRLLEWFTIWKGKKVLVTLGASRKEVVRYTEIATDYWPIVDRAMYALAHDWDGVSIPDLVEDKQRARSVAQNLALAGIKLGLHPTYLYNTNKIKSRDGLAVDFNRHIPIDGDVNAAIVPVERQGVKSEVDWILGILDNAAQKATATPSIQQGVQPDEKQTATATNAVSAGVDTRYSLSAKIWGWSEKEFWRQWYDLYKEHFAKDIDEKVVRLNGAMGSKWRKLTRENIVATYDPDIKIESKVVSEAKKINDLQKYRLWIKDVMATAPQDFNARFALRKIGVLSGFTKEEIEQILPPTVDELNAEAENLTLDKDEIEKVEVYDDDFVHMVVHNRAADTSAKKAHIEAHRKAMMLKKAQPALDMNKQPEAPVDAANMPVEFMKGGAPTSGIPGAGAVARI